MAKRLRIKKLAKELYRSEQDVLAAAKELGLPYTLGSHQLSADAEQKLRAKLKDWQPPTPVTAIPLRRSSQKALSSDPLADSWMELAMQDSTGFQKALADRSADQLLNKKQRFNKRVSTEDLHAHFRGESLQNDQMPRPARKTPSGPPSQSIDAILKGLGFNGKSVISSLEAHLPPESKALLEKSTLGPANTGKLSDFIKKAISRSCGDSICERALNILDKPILLISDPSKCDSCEGSNARRSMQALARTLDQYAVTRVLVVGGRPNHLKELPSMLPPHIELKLVYGGSRISKAEAKAQLQWSQVAALWGPNIRQHRLSERYKRSSTGAGRRIVHVDQRGIEALAQTLTQQLRQEKR